MVIRLKKIKSEVVAQRAVSEAEYIIKTGCTIRECAKHFGVSKSTCHKDIKFRLPEESRSLTLSIRGVLDEHIKLRAMRGGLATQEKYRQAKKG